uniref:Peptidase S1 domain-containing protein n=1 Tax=Cyprinus carpio carpio TaxID=630221 RepID=A0A8C1A883_CYPCA
MTDSSISLSAHVNVGIVNGKKAKPHSRPYIVSIQKNGHHNCCGFLMSDEFVLTAAYYSRALLSLNRNEILTAVVGAHDLKNMTEGSVRIRVKSYHQHPDYSSDTRLHDIMLLRLQEKVQLSPNAEPISLMNKKYIKPGTACSVAGWEKLKFKGSASDHLMEANMEILKITLCSLVCGKTADSITSFADYNVFNSPEHPTVYTKISANGNQISNGFAK